MAITVRSKPSNELMWFVNLDIEFLHDDFWRYDFL